MKEDCGTALIKYMKSTKQNRNIALRMVEYNN